MAMVCGDLVPICSAHCNPAISDILTRAPKCRMIIASRGDYELQMVDRMLSFQLVFGWVEFDSGRDSQGFDGRR